MGRLDNKVAIITGSAGGLGSGIARLFVDEGASVLLNDVNESLLKEKAKLLGDYNVDYVVGDVSNKNDVENMMNKVIKRFGKLDILVNNAGGSLHTPKDLEDIKEEDWDKVIDVNLKGSFLTSQEAVKLMKENGRGKIINMASMAGRTASLITGVAYAASKGGVIALTRRLAKEVGPYNINVNAIAPGLVLSGDRIRHLFYHENTEEQRRKTLDEIALKRVGEVEDIANAALYLSTEESNYVTGSVLDVNGGRFIG